jgi:hypothetical protein
LRPVAWVYTWSMSEPIIVNILDLHLAETAAKPSWAQMALIAHVHQAFDDHSLVTGRDIYGQTGPLYRDTRDRIGITPP